MELSPEFILQILVYLVTIGTLAGVILTKLKYIEKKQDKYNDIIERTYKLENGLITLAERLEEHINQDNKKAH